MTQLLRLEDHNILSLGCADGYAIQEIIKKQPNSALTIIDLSQQKLQEIHKKNKKKKITIVHSDFFMMKFADTCYDAAIAFHNMHHFTAEQKLPLYQKIYHALNDGGRFIICDYMLSSEAEAQQYIDKMQRRIERHILRDIYSHINIPCTFYTEMKLLQAAGFNDVKMVMRMDNTTLIVGEKK